MDEVLKFLNLFPPLGIIALPFARIKDFSWFEPKLSHRGKVVSVLVRHGFAEFARHSELLI